MVSSEEHVDDQVSGYFEFTVDLATRNFSCGEFQDYIWPCVHARAVTTRTEKSFMDCGEHYYEKPSLEDVYADIIHSVPIDAIPFDGLLPPVARAQAGRPKKVRTRNRNELQSEDSPFICSLCNVRGHNK
jgi:hypothetical protein